MTAEGPVAFCGRCARVIKDGDAVVRTELRTHDDVWGIGPIYHEACLRGPKRNLRVVSRDVYRGDEPGGR
jgi:hypothetical protein